MNLKSKLRTALKQTYYRTSVPFNRLFNKQYIVNHKSISIEVSNICNHNCIFCGYQKYKGKRTLMPNDKFEKILNEVTEAGYETILLTPLTGEVFVDNSFFTKLDILESHEKVKDYSFTTNFSMPSLNELKELLKYKKLESLKISLYGHDLESFQRIGRSGKKDFDSLIRNLQFLLDNIEKIDFTISLALRTYLSFNMERCNTELCQIIKKLRKYKNVQFGSHTHYTNWAGAVTQKDVEGTDIILKDDKDGYKNGPCIVLFSHLISSTGKVLACACRDAYRELEIGDISNEKLKDIISYDNKKYRNIIEDQIENKFTGPCKDCDFYRSIYAFPHFGLYKKTNTNFINIDTYFREKKESFE